MKMTTSQLEKVIFETVENESLAGDLGVRIVANAFVKYAGIEIVPDPEPELPPRPWTVSVLPNRLEILDGEQRVIFLYGRLPNETLGKEFAIFNALVSAYNAAGERKRIEITKGALEDYWVNGERGQVNNKEASIGAYVRRHASDLGLEIVES